MLACGTDFTMWSMSTHPHMIKCTESNITQNPATSMLQLFHVVTNSFSAAAAAAWWVLH